MMMDEVFGNGSPGEADSNFMGAIAWKTRNTDNRVKSYLSVDHEYVLVYRKTPNGSLRGRVIDRSDFDNPDNDARGPYVTDPLTGKATATDRPNLHFVITNPKTKDRYEPDPSRGWITDREGMKQLIEDGRIWWPPDPNTGKPRKKRFLSETAERMPESSFWSDIRGQSGADEVDQILGKRLFSFPKLTEFMIRLLDVATGADALILDCTAGSGTTGHAILALNKRDSGKRTFVLVQQPYDSKDDEKAGLNICEMVTAERVKKAAKGYTYKKPKRGGGEQKVTVDALGGSFTYARLGSRLFGEYRDLGDKLPAFEELAKYIFYTETSQEFDAKAMNAKTGRIGEHGSTAYYLLYTPDAKSDRALDLAWLKEVGEKEKCRNLVVYCEKLWAHRDELNQWEKQAKKSLRTMIVPFQLK
jgi:hypothetical protein